jgi:hypothetical protein
MRHFIMFVLLIVTMPTDKVIPLWQVKKFVKIEKVEKPNLKIMYPDLEYGNDPFKPKFDPFNFGPLTK